MIQSTASFIFASEEGTRTIKCNSPVDCCLRRFDGGEPSTDDRQMIDFFVDIHYNLLDKDCPEGEHCGRKEKQYENDDGNLYCLIEKVMICIR